MMRKSFVLFNFFLLLFVSCNYLKLTDEEARRLIREAKGYPMKPESITIQHVPKNSKLEQEIKRLIDEGYLTKGKVYGKTFFLKATDKGKNLISHAIWYDESDAIGDIRPGFCFMPLTHKLDIKRITEILIDSDNKTALVKYEIAYIPTDYYYKLVVFDKVNVENISKRKNSFVKKDQIRLKKWDQGWRVME